MRDIFLGDSYDLVKRFWRDQLHYLAPLYAHPRFVLGPLRARYTALTMIPVLDPDNPPEAPYGLFFDPHTGIPLPEDTDSNATISHAPLPYIVKENARLRPHYMICFDQSVHRKHKRGLDVDEQRAVKRDHLRDQGIASFYYISHAPFLFMAQNTTTLQEVRDRMIALGIPEQTPDTIRLQPIQ